jgi:hypothetical protein
MRTLDENVVRKEKEKNVMKKKREEDKIFNQADLLPRRSFCLTAGPKVKRK